MMKRVNNMTEYDKPYLSNLTNFPEIRIEKNENNYVVFINNAFANEYEKDELIELAHGADLLKQLIKQFLAE